MNATNKHSLIFGAMIGGAAVLTVFSVSAGLIPALMFGLLAGVPTAALMLAVQRPEPLPPPAPWDDDVDAYAYCTPSRRATRTARSVASPVTIVPELAPAEELAPIAVPDWPMPAVVEPEVEPVPVVTGRTAARFAALEIER